MRTVCLLCLFFMTSVAVAADSPDRRAGYEMPVDRDQTEDILSEYRHLAPERLLDTAIYYEEMRKYDTALICYSLIIDNAGIESDDDVGQRLKAEAMARSGIIYYYRLNDYVKAFQLLNDALALCEIYPYPKLEIKILSNIGNIYNHLDDYQTSVQYYSKALELNPDSIDIFRLHNNLADTKMKAGELDEALSHIEKSLEVNSSLRNDMELYILLHTAAAIYQEKGLLDSAFRYFQMGLEDARKNGKIEYEAEILSGLGKLFFETGQPGKAELYIASSSAIAKENNINSILLGNYLVLSRMEHLRGDNERAYEHLELYNRLKDSLFSADKLANINELQRVDETLKVNRQIENLKVEQQIKERTIGYQQVILAIALAVLLLVAAVLLFVWSQKRKLNKAYRTLFEKNMEIMELQDGSPRKHPKSASHYDNDGELLDRILSIMEDTEVICNPKFSINVLSSLVEANHMYVSQVINTTLHKNFRSFLNGYRIREAQRLFSESDAAKYTIESVSLQLGYKSMNTFRAAFQEITGVSPGFYLKSIREAPKG